MRGLNLTNIMYSVGIWGLCLAMWSSCGDVPEKEVGKETFTLQGELKQCLADTIRLYETDGSRLVPLMRVPLTKAGSTATFNIAGKLPHRGFYYVGTSTDNVMPILLGGEENLRLVGNGTNWQTGVKIENSPQNEQFQSMMQEISGLNKLAEDAAQKMYAGQKLTPRQKEVIIKEFDEVRIKHRKAVDSLQKLNPYFKLIAEMSLYLPLNVEKNPEKYPNSVTHFAKEYFQNVDFLDPDLSYMQLMSENVGTYTRTLAANIQSQDTLEIYLNDLLKRAAEKSRTHRLMLSSIIAGLDAQNSGLFMKYSDLFAKLYPEADETNAKNKERYTSLKETEEKLKKIGVGATPPEINMPNSEGVNISLNDTFKNKAVLVYFWASWSAKSRSFQTELLRLHKKFSPKGFHVLAVSLDQDKIKWVSAIKEDKAENWEHVSELKGWDSQVVKDYSIEVIPRNFLLDTSGKIVAQDLKGIALESKLAEWYLPKKPTTTKKKKKK
ncbi:MAG: peroxiredoxin family protein [Bacteroidia bacterium]